MKKKGEIIPPRGSKEASVDYKLFGGNQCSNTLLVYREQLVSTLKERLVNCGCVSSSWTCEKCIRLEIIPHNCDIRMCKNSRCINHRYGKQAHKTRLLIKQFNTQAKLLTITLKGKRNLKNKRKFDYYATEFNRWLRKVDKNIKYIRVLEITGTPSKAHVHYHYVIDSPLYIPQKIISKKWHEITKDSYITHIKKINSGIGVKYVSKYVSKPFDAKRTTISFFAKYLYKTRWFWAYGFDKIDLKKHGFRCPICGDFMIFGDWVDYVRETYHDKKEVTYNESS